MHIIKPRPKTVFLPTETTVVSAIQNKNPTFWLQNTCILPPSTISTGRSVRLLRLALSVILSSYDHVVKVSINEAKGEHKRRCCLM